MKRALYFIATFLILSGFLTLNEEKSNLNSREVLNKCIGLYDPGNQWKTYSGKVHLNTIFPQFSNEEILEINNETGFYQSTILRPDGNIIRGMNGRECFHRIGEQTDLTEEQIRENGLDCHSISIAREHHTCHFGFILNTEKAGLVLDNSLQTEKFNGWDCFVLTFTGYPEDVIHDYYVGIRKAYIDQEDFSLRGMYFKHPDAPARKCIFTGKIEVNDIHLPQVATVYLADNNALYFVDIFNPID